MRPIGSQSSGRTADAPHWLQAQWRSLAGGAAIALLTLLAYMPCIVDGGFIWDDDSYITANRHVQTPDGIWKVWVPRETPQYYPVVFTSFWIEYQIWADNPTGYHLINVLLHAANAILVWRLCTMLRVPDGAFAAWLIAAIFALHPVHVESVAWITERKNVLSALFYLVSAIMYLRFDSDSMPGAPPGARAGLYMGSLLCFVLALLSKTVTCSLPAALILMMLWQRKRITFERLLPLVPFFFVGLVLAVNTAHIERTHVGAEGIDFDFSLADRSIIAARALLFYPQKLLWPWPVMFIYPRWNIDDHNVLAYWPVVASLAMVVAAGIAYARGWRGPGLTLAFYAGTVFPALGFFNVYPMIFSYVADHFQYLASLGIITLIIGAAASWRASARYLPVGGLVVLSALFAMTWGQSSTYSSEESVWRDTLSKNDQAWMPHNNLAKVLLNRSVQLLIRGDAERSRLAAEEGLEHASRSLELRPDHQTALSNKAEALRLLGRPGEAIPLASRALDLIIAREQNAPGGPRALSPKQAEAQWELGRLFELNQQLEEALACYQRSQSLNPGDLTVRTELARLLVRLGRLSDALPHFEAVLEQDPVNVNALGFLGEMAEREKRFVDAIAYYNRGLEHARNDAEFIHIAYKLLRVRVTCDDPEFRDPQIAVQLGESLRPIDPGNPFILGMLAQAYAQVGRVGEAISVTETALGLAQRAGLPDLVKELDANLQRFNALKQPAAEPRPR